jgi:hypothetical protein
VNDMSDDDLRARFAELRNDDHARAPDFGAVLTRAELRARTTAYPRIVRVAWIAAAAGIVFSAGILFQQSRGRDLVPPGSGQAATISTWTSPTADLLRTPGSELLAPPSLFSSILDGATGATIQPQGD